MLNCDEIELILNGCEKTFNKFYQKTQRYIYKLCFDILKNHHDCEEALNDVYIKVINNLKSFNGGSFKYWVVTITKNTANEILRKKINHFNREVKYQERQQILTSNHDQEEFSDCLNQIKQLVNQDVYEIMVMHLVRGLKFKEIAALKQVSVAVVLGQYHRAMKKIRKEIKL